MVCQRHMPALVSILIPVFNREGLIEETIASAQAQIYPNIEIVVSDNHSDDATWAIVSRLAKSDDRIRAIRNPQNIGPVRNWLTCLEAASGAYAKILFSDDLLFPHSVARMMEAMDGTGPVLCRALIGSSLDQAQPHYFPSGEGRINANRLAEMMTTSQAPVSPGAALFRTEDLRRNLKVDFPTATRYDFQATGAGPDAMSILLTAGDHGGAIIVPEPLTFFRAHEGSLTIGETRPLVAAGYRAAFSWFFRTHIGLAAWRRYVTSEWLRTTFERRRWSPLRAFLRQHDGSGSTVEVLRVFAVALIIGPPVLLRSILRRYRRKW